MQQVIAAHVGHVAANGRQRQNDPGVIRGFRLVEPSGFGVDVLGHVLQNLLVVVLHAGDVPVGTGQTDDHPLAADGADAGRTQSLHVVAGGDVGIADLAHGFQHGKLRLGGGQNIVVVNQLLLQIGQGIVSLPGGLNVLLGILCDASDLAYFVHDLLRLLLVLFRSRKLGVGGLGVGELLDVRDQILLILGQSVISLAGSFNTGLALFRDGVFDLVNKLDNLVGLELVPLPGGFLEGGELRDQFLLLSSQLVVAVPCGVDGRAAVDRDRADLGNEVVYRFGFGLVVRLFQLFVLILGVSELLVVCDLFLFFRTQSVIGFPCRVDFRLAGVGEGHGADLIDQVDDILGCAGFLNRSHSTLFFGVVIGIVQDDFITLLQIPSRYANIRMASVNGVHPAGELAIVKFSKAVDGRNVNGIILIIIACVNTHAVLREYTLQDIPYRFRCVRFHIGFAGP